MDSQLPIELLINIVSRLDALSAACFALTSRWNYISTLMTYNVPRLEDICPRDVRKRLPGDLEERAYNILTLRAKWYAMRRRENTCRWKIRNPLNLPDEEARRRSGIILPAGYSPDEAPLLVEHLAFLRHAAWYQATPPPQTFDKVALKGIEVATPTPACVVYKLHRLPWTSDRNIEREFQMAVLSSLADQDIVDSTEFMWLMARLARDGEDLGLPARRKVGRVPLSGRKSLSRQKNAEMNGHGHAFRRLLRRLFRG